MNLLAASTLEQPSGWRGTLFISSLCALLLGLSVYLLDRNWESTLALAAFAEWQTQTLDVFGYAGNFLPSLLHAYGLSVLLVLCLCPGSRGRLYVCAGWFAIAAGLELIQLDSLATLLFGQDPSTLITLAPVQRYALFGQFDFADLLATALGCLAAWFATAQLGRIR